MVALVDNIFKIIQKCGFSLYVNDKGH